jgi:hypothetical protein
MHLPASQKVGILLVISICIMLAILFAYGKHPSTSQATEKKRLASSNVDHCFSCNKNDVLCGITTNSPYKSSSSLKAEFRRLVLQSGQQLCDSVRRFGSRGDGGYNICLSNNWKPEKGSCLVYSFGIQKNWKFDEAMALYGCEVHSFDPSIGKEDHQHSKRVYFHNVGLWGDNIVTSENWTLQSLSTIRKRLGHDKMIIDILKVDVESAEWPFLRNVLFCDTDQLTSVKQLLLEFHSPRRRPKNNSQKDLSEIVYYLRKLLATHEAGGQGFSVFGNRVKNWCCRVFAGLMPPGVNEKCCYESFLINTRYQSTTT